MNSIEKFLTKVHTLKMNNYVKPKLEEVKGKGWVMNGRDNSFYQYIIDRNTGSVTNGTINSSYTNYIYGKGIYAPDASHKPNQWAEFVSLIKPTELKKIVSDFQIFGEASIQIVKTKDKKKVAGIYHLPKQSVVPSIENEDGEIESYWYCKNWKKQAQNPPEEFPAFGINDNAPIEIYVIKPYVAGNNYFGTPDYIAGLQYAEIEEEISNFYISVIKNGFSNGYIINYPNGSLLTEEQRTAIKSAMKSKATGSSNAQDFIMNWMADNEDKVTIETTPVNEQQHKQWEVLQKESREQIMVAHKVTSPMLFGIKDSTGFGNNADEMDTAEAQLMKRVIAPKQQFIIDAIKEIVAINGIMLDLYFKPLTEPQGTVKASKENKQGDTLKMFKAFLQLASSNSDATTDPEKKNLDTSVADELIKLGEDEPGDEWELVETKIIENHDTDIHFTSTGTAIPNAKSAVDGKLFKSRFRYLGKINTNSRPFCIKMLTANKLYRLEDINKMSATVVNEGWGPRGTDTYDIFLYKGGGNCKHAWQRETYRLKADVNSPLADVITPAEARKAGEILPAFDQKAYTRPTDMPYNGFLPPASK